MLRLVVDNDWERSAPELSAGLAERLGYAARRAGRSFQSCGFQSARLAKAWRAGWRRADSELAGAN